MKISLLITGLLICSFSQLSYGQIQMKPSGELPLSVTSVPELNSQAALISAKQAQIEKSIATSRGSLAEMKSELSNLLNTYHGMLKSEYAKATSENVKTELMNEILSTEKQISALTSNQR